MGGGGPEETGRRRSPGGRATRVSGGRSARLTRPRGGGRGTTGSEWGGDRRSIDQESAPEPLSTGSDRRMQVDHREKVKIRIGGSRRTRTIREAAQRLVCERKKEKEKGGGGKNRLMNSLLL